MKTIRQLRKAKGSNWKAVKQFINEVEMDLAEFQIENEIEAELMARYFERLAFKVRREFKPYNIA